MFSEQIRFSSTEKCHHYLSFITKNFKIIIIYIICYVHLYIIDIIYYIFLSTYFILDKNKRPKKQKVLFWLRETGSKLK